MKAVSAAYRARSLQAFQETLDEHRAQLVEDPFVNTHLTVRARPTAQHNKGLARSARVCTCAWPPIWKPLTASEESPSHLEAETPVWPNTPQPP